MSKILFLTLHRKDRSPGQRFRHEQYLQFLEQEGFEISYANLLNADDDKNFYAKGRLIQKVLVGLKAMFRRIGNLFGQTPAFIFVYRDAFFFGTFFERLFRRKGAKMIFDFDDSIWLQDENKSSSLFHRLKNPAKTSKIISLCDTVIAGNQYLADYALQYNENVKIIPTTIDLSEYSRLDGFGDPERVCIGWSGSFSTIKHFETSLAALEELKERFGSKVMFKVIGDGNYSYEGLGIVGQPWRKETEIEDLCEMDIGIMPLPDDDWSKGKCGLKGLQYMALEIPTVMSPVGVNSDIIEDGVNGFLASTKEEWIEKLALLIESKELRQRLGNAGRATVEKHYSVDANQQKWLDIFKS